MKYDNPRHEYKVEGKGLTVRESLGGKSTPKPYKKGGSVKKPKFERDEDDGEGDEE